MARRCARPTCPELAVATLTFDYGAQEVWIDLLAEVDDPANHDLCERHADGQTAPHGWVLQDRRTPVTPIWQARAS
jgi:Protein of unknown function (DUF3499)